MNRTAWIVALMAVGCFVLIGCNPSGSTAPETSSETASAITLCGDCGNVKGADACCAADAQACDECGLTKESPGCCKIEKGTDALLCGECGEVEGSTTCCAEGAEKCDQCSLTKGSPGCCLKAADA